jgi:hypothetical protein
VDQFAVLVLGKEKDYEAPLSSVGTVTAVDITIPKPAQQALGPATAETASRGKALLKGARQAIGGAALDSVKDYTTVMDMAMSTPQGDVTLKMEATSNLSGKLIMKMTTPMGEMTQGYDGQTMWMRTPQGVRDVGGPGKGEVEGGFFRDTIALLRNVDNPAYTVQSLGPAEVEGQKAEAVAVSDEARKLQVKLWIDPKTNLPVKKGYSAAMMGAPGDIEEFYSDYRDVGGLKLPHKIRLTRNGQKFGEQTITEIRINPGVDESAYKKPN